LGNKEYHPACKKCCYNSVLGAAALPGVIPGKSGRFYVTKLRNCKEVDCISVEACDVHEVNRLLQKEMVIESQTK